MTEQIRVDHVSIAVNHIDTALRFFGSCLPIEMMRVRISDGGLRNAGRDSNPQ